jgi:hypothetical protein
MRRCSRKHEDIVFYGFIATKAYNLKRITNVLGAAKLTKELLHAR